MLSSSHRGTARGSSIPARAPSSVSVRVDRRLGAGPVTLEDHKHAQPLVADEAVLGSRRDEDGASLLELDPLVLDLEHAAALQHDVDLVVLVRLLAVGLGRDEHVDADLETGGAVDDLVAAGHDGALSRALESVSWERRGLLGALSRRPRPQRIPESGD